MKDWFFSLRGALTLSILALISEMWRGFLDAMYVLPVDFGDDGPMQLAAVIFTAIFAGWTWAIWSAWQASRRGLIAVFAINGLVLLVIPVSWLLFYCPAECQASAGLFNLANALNLVLGLLAGISLALQIWRRPRIVAKLEGSET